MASRRLDLEIFADGLDELLKGFQQNFSALTKLRIEFQSFSAIANGTFQSLVGSSIQLEQQLISIRGALAATNDITSGGKSIADPLERINKLAPSVNKAIAQVRKDSIELANVTSDDLIGVFQIISGEVGNIGANLDDAAKLTKAFGSSFSALGLPLAGARQEITSILQGTIDQNSALAKTLAINNTQIQQEKAKGTLVDFLLKKTEALAASQGLVAKTFGGVSSNILEVFQRLQESFGKVVLPPIVEQLTKIYNSLLAAQPQIEAFISNLTSGLVAIATQVGTVLNQFVPTIQGLFTAIGAIAQTSVPLLGVALNVVLGVLSAIAEILDATIVPILGLANTGIGRFVISVGLVAIAVNAASVAIAVFAGRLGFVGPIAQGLVASIQALISVLQIQFATAATTAGGALAIFKVALTAIATTIGTTIASIQAFNLALVSAIATGVTSFVAAIPSATIAVIKFAIATGTTAVKALIAFAATIPAVIVGITALALSAIPVAISALTTFATVTIPAATKSFLIFSATAIPAAITALTTFVTVTIPATITSLKALVLLGISAAIKGFGALVASLLTVAVVAGGLVVAIGLLTGGFLAYKAAVDASRKTVDAWKGSVDSTGLIVVKFTKRLQELRDQLKAGTITPEGRKQLEDYKRYVSDAAREIPSKIKDIQDAVEKNKALGIKFNEDEANQEIKRLKQFQQEALGTLDETAILGQKAINQGTLKAQFNTVSKNYFDEFRKGTQLAVGQAKQFIGVIQQEIELGFISKEEGLKRLKALSQGEFLLKEDRVAAAKAATAIIDTETKKQTALIQAFQSETQLTIERGLLSEIDGINKLGELKGQEKQAEIDGIDEKLKYVVKGSELERDLITQRKKAIADLRKSELDFIQEQVAALRSGLGRELSANADLRKKAEQATQADILALKIGGFENDRQLEEQSLQQKARNIESELFDKRRLIEFEKTALTNSRLSQKEREEAILKIGNAETELAKLNLEATDNLIARNKLLYEQKINNLEIEKTTTDRVTKLLESQNSLLGAQIKLYGAIADARLKGAENQLTVLKEADSILKGNRDKANAEEQKRRDAQRAQILSGLDEEKRKKQELLFAEEDAALEQQKAAKDGAIAREKERLTRERLAALGISAGTNELAIARQIYDQEQKILELKARKFEQDQANAKRELEIQIQQSQIRDKQLLLEGKIALTRAKASGSADAIRDALELNALLEGQVANNKQIGDIQRQTLATTQGAELATFNQEQQGAQFKNKIAGAEAGLTGLQSSDGIVARSLALNPAAIAKESEARKKLADAKDPASVKAIQEQRKQDLASVADGAVAFENTSQQIADNFASLPNSLKATKDGLKEVIAQSKELSENPIFKSREEQAARQKQAEAIAKQQAQRQSAAKFLGFGNDLTGDTIALSSARQDLAKTQASNAKITADRAKTRALVKNLDGNYTDQQLDLIVSGKGKEADALRADANRKAEQQFANLRAIDPSISEETAREVIGNPDGKIARAWATRIALRKNAGLRNPIDRQVQQREDSVGLGYFTGGLPPVGEPVTVNERGQEAVTNLQTLETTLLPNGERTVQFEAPSWVHNASETKQLGSLGVFDSNQLPNINFGAIASALRINNADVVRELRILRSELAASMSRPNLINNFSNDPRPDLTAYRLQNQLLRV